MTKIKLRYTLILMVYCLNSCTKSNEVGCWKCTIKISGSEKTRTVCDKTLQEAIELVTNEEIGYFGSSAKNITCKGD
ncbi:hypothetical protein [Pedobacter nyackensis]|nr:hypothetical protein [Pedobacter nyackensis]